MKSSGKGMAVTGIILSIVGLLLMVGMMIIISIFCGTIFEIIQNQLLQSSGY